MAKLKGHWLRTKFGMAGDWHEPKSSSGYQKDLTYVNDFQIADKEISAATIKAKEVQQLQTLFNNNDMARKYNQLLNGIKAGINDDEQLLKEIVQSNETLKGVAQAINDLYVFSLKDNNGNTIKNSSGDAIKKVVPGHKMDINTYIQRIQEIINKFDDLCKGERFYNKDELDAQFHELSEALEKGFSREWKTNFGNVNRAKGLLYEYIATEILNTNSVYTAIQIGSVVDSETGRQLLTDLIMTDDFSKFVSSLDSYARQQGSFSIKITGDTPKESKEKLAQLIDSHSGLDKILVNPNSLGWYQIYDANNSNGNMGQLIYDILKTGKFYNANVTLKINDNVLDFFKKNLINAQVKVGLNQNLLNNSVRDQTATSKIILNHAPIADLRDFYNNFYLNDESLKEARGRKQLGGIASTVVSQFNYWVAEEITETSLGTNQFFVTASGVYGLGDYLNKTDSYISLSNSATVTWASILGCENGNLGMNLYVQSQ